MSAEDNEAQRNEVFEIILFNLPAGYRPSRIVQTRIILNALEAEGYEVTRKMQRVAPVEDQEGQK